MKVRIMQYLRKRTAQRRLAPVQAGMTLLEILIVLAILAVVMGLLFGPALFESLGESKVKTTQIIVQEYANKAYAQWSLKSNEQCPGSLSDLARYTNHGETKDGWGKELVMVCAGSGGDLPDGIPFGVISVGEDGKPGTADDIKSWERGKKKEE